MSKSNRSGSTKSKFHEPNSTLFVMGYVDLIFKLRLTNKDLLKSEEDQNKVEENDKQAQTSENRYYNIKDLNSIEDLKFLANKKELWDRIVISGGNDTLNQLLTGNKIAKKKCKIEFFGYNRPIFQDNTEFFSEIFNYVCLKNNLFINETPLEESARYTLNIILYHKGESHTISLGTSYEEEEKERIKTKRRRKAMKEQNQKTESNTEKKEEKKKNKKQKEEEEESSEEDDDDDEEQFEEDYEETDAMKERKIPKFRRGSSILVKMNPIFDKYSMAYINFNDVKKVPGDFKLSDLNELLKFFKSKGTLIFVNFYKPKKPKIEVEEEKIDLHENDNEIMGEGKSKVNQMEEIEEPKEEKKEKKEQTRPTKKMRDINQLYDYTNIFFFDVKQCVKIFNKHYENFTDDNINNLKKISRAKIFDYFIKGIAPATKEEVAGMKTGLFIDQLVKLTIIFATRKAANNQEFDCQPYPKINHNNMELVKQYKDLLTQKKNDYYSDFISSIIIHCASYAPNSQSTEVIYPSFLISLEVIKKKLECEKNDLPIDDNIYRVRLDEKIIAKNLQIFSSGGKESGFVLDCTNKEKSTMKDYVSLYDYHLRTFFSSETNRKNLKDKGFINSKGFIMYDPEHKNLMKSQNLKKKKKKILSNEEIMDSIKGIDVPSNIKDKEIDAQKLAEKKNVATESKLPVSKELMTMKSTHKKKKRKKRNHGSSSKGKSSEEWGSSESDSGNNSGNNSGTVSGEEEDLDEKDKKDKTDKMDKTDKKEKADKTDKTDKTDKKEKADKTDKKDKTDKTDKIDTKSDEVLLKDKLKYD